LPSLACAVDDPIEALRFRATEQLARTRAEVCHRPSAQTTERLGVAGHRAVVLFLEEGEPKLVSYPTDKF